MGIKSKEKQEKLAQALRENLAKRKEQARLKPKTEEKSSSKTVLTEKDT